VLDDGQVVVEAGEPLRRRTELVAVAHDLEDEAPLREETEHRRRGADPRQCPSDGRRDFALQTRRATQINQADQSVGRQQSVMSRGRNPLPPTSRLGGA
jgi:hypothetical protein